MDDLISRQALLKLMGEEPFNWTDSGQELQAVEDYRNFKNIVEQLPPVNPQPTAHWICGLSWKCSKCGYEDDRALGTDFCPHCGARMVEEQESEEV